MSDAVDLPPPAAPIIKVCIEQEILPAWRGADAIAGRLVDPVGAMTDGRAAPVASLRVQAQRIDALATAGLFSNAAADLRRATALLAAVLDQFLSADGEPGFPRAIDLEGDVVDPSRDFEAHAWLLRAVAKVHAMTRSSETLLVADLILEFLDAHLKRGEVGYRPDTSGGQIAGQRGHLRLLEGLLALHRATERPCDLARAQRIVELFRFHLLDRAAGGVPERFDPDWRAVHVGPTAFFFPRTSAEWVVALSRFRRQSGDGRVAADLAVLRRTLLSSRGGDGLIADVVGLDGKPAADGAALAAQLAFFGALHALDGVSEAGARAALALDARIAELFLAPAVKGCWIESLDGEGRSRGEPLRVSTLASLVEIAALERADVGESHERTVAFAPALKRGAQAA